MPRTSYALKTFGSSIGRMLTLAFIATLVLAVATAAGSGRKARSIFGLEVGVVGSTSHLALVRLDPASLAPQGRLDLGQDWGGRYERRYGGSPGGGTLA